MADKGTLKEGNTTPLTVFTALHAVALGWVLLGVPLSWTSIQKLGVDDVSKGLFGLVATLLVRLVAGVGDSHTKAVLVFWRWKDPLPGSRAFSELAAKDPRIDLDRLSARIGGPLPSDPVAQNQLWYRLSQSHADASSVQAGHADYLLFRDMVWLSCLLAAGGTAMLVAFHYVRAALVFLACETVVYLIGRRAARLAGERFVLTVLSRESAQEVNRLVTI